MLQMKDEVKHECIKLFQQMMQDFRQNAQPPPAPSAPIENKRIYGLFA